MIPGSGFLGAVRSVHEALAGGCLRVLNTDWVAVHRHPASPSVAKDLLAWGMCCCHSANCGRSLPRRTRRSCGGSTRSARMTRKGARAFVRQVRRLSRHRDVADAMAAGQVSESCGLQITGLVNKLPEELRAQTGTILLDAAAAGALPEDLALIAAAAWEQWRAQHPDPDDDDGFDDRYLAAGTTFGGAAVLRGNLTPECNAAVQAVLEALGKKAGPEDHRTEGQRFHDALQLGCELLIRARMVPGRAGADTQVIAHIPFPWLRSQPGAAAVEEAWLRARAGQAGYLTGAGAETAGCDAMIVPVVIGHADMTVIDTMIELALSAAGHQLQPRPLSPDAHAALRYAIARLAIDFVSGPHGLAGLLRTRLLSPPYATPSLPLDVG